MRKEKVAEAKEKKLAAEREKERLKVPSVYLLINHSIENQFKQTLGTNASKVKRLGLLQLCGRYV